MAKATQRPGQTKEQTKLIAQGIQKGIDEYKKQQKVHARAADKAKKQRLRAERIAPTEEVSTPEPQASAAPSSSWLPWALLIVSWLGFAGYWWLQHAA